MQFTIQNTSRENINTLMRKAGYSFLNDSFVRPLGARYPRFHVYIKQDKDNLIFNLHLDQKRPIYKGATAHSGDYDGPVIEQEAERIREIL